MTGRAATALRDLELSANGPRQEEPGSQGRGLDIVAVHRRTCLEFVC
jgi:hypothetical protein